MSGIYNQVKEGVQEATGAPGVTGFNQGASNAQSSQDLSDAVLGAATRNTAEVRVHADAIQYCSHMHAHAANQLLDAQQQSNVTVPSASEIKSGATSRATGVPHRGSDVLHHPARAVVNWRTRTCGNWR